LLCALLFNFWEKNLLEQASLNNVMSPISGILIYSAVVPLGVPKSVLTQKVHPAPNTQQAEQSWLHTRKE
jgi:hypothetical protein